MPKMDDRIKNAMEKMETRHERNKRILKDVGFPPKTKEQHSLIVKNGKHLSKRMIEQIVGGTPDAVQSENDAIIVSKSVLRVVLGELCVTLEAQEEMLQTAFTHMEVQTEALKKARCDK